MSLKKNSKVEGLQEARPRTKGALKSKLRRAKERAEERVIDEIERPKNKAKLKKAKEGVTYHMQSHIIQDEMQKAPKSVAQIASETGLSVARVQGHVDWMVKKGRASVNKKGIVVINPGKEMKYRKEA